MLAGLDAARAQIDERLLLLAGVSGSSTSASTSRSKSEAAVHACERRARAEVEAEAVQTQALLGRPASTIVPAAPPPREQMLKDEQQTVAELERPNDVRDGCETWAGLLAAQPKALRRAVKLLRSTEASLDFQAELLVEQRRASAEFGYTSDNFAYGSTPLRSWLMLFESPPLRAKRRAAHLEGPLRYYVLGSSLGSLCVYGACVYGIETRGIELMPGLAQAAQRIVTRAGVVGVSFECADMLGVDLSEADVLLLASQCWDAPLVAALGAKLLAELRPGALVIDYTPALGEASRRGDDGEQQQQQQPGGRRFVLEHSCEAPVSWGGALRFYIWRVT